MFTIKSVVYPDKIENRLSRLLHTGADAETNAVGTDANFTCGSFIRYKLVIDADKMQVSSARFSSNGCGFMLAAADVIAASITGRRLADLHGFGDDELESLLAEELGNEPHDRTACIASCINALRGAFADFRSRQIEEFRGERAVICTCFGVAEDTIENLVETEKLSTVDAVTIACNAGGGCGSCRMLIQEIIDTHACPSIDSDNSPQDR